MLPIIWASLVRTIITTTLKKYLSLQEAFLHVGNWFTFHEQESHQESLHAN